MFVPGKPFQHSLILADKPGAYPSEVRLQCSTLGQAPDLTRKYQTRLKKLAMDKLSSLLRKWVNYGCEKFYTIGPWGQFYINFFVRNLRIFGKSQSVYPWQAFQAQSNIHSFFLWKFLNRGQKSFITLDPGSIASFSLLLKNGPYELECFITLGQKGLPGTSAQAYWAHS